MKPLKIAFTGPESSGKTTMAEWMSGEFSLTYVEEFARDYLSSKKSYSFNDVEVIAEGQFELNREAQAPAILDTEMLVMKIWFEDKYRKESATIRSLLHAQEVDYYFLCKPDIPWEEDPLRENPSDRYRLFEIYVKEMDALNMPYTILEGAMEQRKERVRNYVTRYMV